MENWFERMLARKRKEVKVDNSPVNMANKVLSNPKEYSNKIKNLAMQVIGGKNGKSNR